MCKLLNEKSLLFAALLLSAVCMSCSHDPHDENQDPSNTDVHEWEDSTLSGDAVMGSAMTFKVGGGMSVERTAQTRATTDINGVATFSAGDLVAVAVTRSGGSEVVKLYQVKSDGSLEYAGGDNDPFVWKSAGESVTIRAWSYGTSTDLSYTLTAPETFDYNLETDQQNNGYRELLYCKADDKSYSGGTISLTFYHQLARVVFNVTHELSGTLSVTSNSVGNTTSFPVTARFAVPTGSSNVGTWTTRSLYNTITPKTETTQSGYEKTYSAVVFPTTYAANTNFFTVTNDEGNYVYKSSGTTLSGGNQYNYTVMVKNGLAIGDIYYSDGTYSKTRDASKTPIGIVVYVNDKSDIGNAATEKDVKAVGIGGHGLVLCLKNASTSRVTWGTKSYSNASGTNVYTASGSYSDSYLTKAIHYQGYARSQAMNNSAYVAARLACQYSGLSAPSSSTGWFLPSAGQWKLIFAGLTPFTTMGQNLGYSTTVSATFTGTYLANCINTALAKADASYDAFLGFVWDGDTEMYWTSSEYSNGLASSPIIRKSSGADIHRNLINDNPGHIFYVRPVLAF